MEATFSAEDQRSTLRLISEACGWLAMALGAAALWGWYRNIPFLESISPHFAVMKINTALCLMLLALPLVSQNLARVEAHRARVFRVCGLAVIGTASWILLEHLFHRHDSGVMGDFSADRPSVITSFDLLCLGTALTGILDGAKKFRRFSQFLTLLAMLASVQAVIGYISGFTYPLHTQMAFHTGFASLFVGAGFLLCQPQEGIMLPFLDLGPAGTLVRRLIFAALVVPFFVNYATRAGLRLGLYSPDASLMIRVFGDIVLLVGITWKSTEALFLTQSKLSAAYDLDIMVRKQNEENLRKAIQARDNFLSIAAHELKTPLTSLKLVVQMNQRSVLSGDAGALAGEGLIKFLGQTERQVDRLAHLVDDMMDISRIETGKLTLSREWFDLGELVTEVVERLSLQFHKVGCVVSIDLCGKMMGYWDRFRLEQVVINLLTNAIRYAPGTRLEIRLAAYGSSVELSVRDHGRGIAKCDQERIFDRFERAISVSDATGLGLGLYIVRQILLMHRGNVRVESEPGQGATFIVTLPTQAAERSLAPTASL